MSKDVFADLLKNSAKSRPAANRTPLAQQKPPPAPPAPAQTALDVDLLDQLSSRASPSSTPQQQSSDDFEKLFDVFKAPASEPQPAAADSSTPAPEPSGTPPESRPPPPTTYAQLVDMGFSEQQAADAVRNTDTFDAAIAYLLDAAHQHSQPARHNTAAPEDLGALVNDLSAELMSKASFLLNTGRRKLKQGIEMYRQHERRNEPAWMRNQAKYKNEGFSEEEEIERVRKLEEEWRQRGRKGENREESKPSSKESSKELTPSSSGSPAAAPAPLLDFGDEPAATSGSQESTTPPVPPHFQTLRQQGSDYFAKGDFTSALETYQRALAQLPENHLCRIIAYSNLAIVYSRLGDAKKQLESAENGVAQAARAASDTKIDDKPVKSYWIKLVAKKAEALEHLERFKEALEAYNLLIENGGFSKPVMDGKRRCLNVLQPQKPAKKPAKNPSSATTPSATVSRVKEHHRKQESLEDEKFALHDKVEQQLQSWKAGKEDNLRALLASLHQILWPELGWKTVGLTDLVLDKKVKLVYMKAVAKTHPDKIASETSTERKLIANGVFITLNQAWDRFKEQNK
ncbi:hypothetical protein KL918_004930 [Ogataea parapolymorpha]|uniref:UBA domain-containing protein 7 n=1 Tax=Ogataea parapolymorpha (strain ATCC 26012 / BCRC 20466 / JCM 22074 / NRRL Y-7560 / DL-1) TaxID=871575 RepID=W1QF12_OGAPD|nr:UBA domain-containing protein 7 [Ogataea parapolymorpha DL-1]ESX00143.1 UBA domain-containing protein 7 [Ogataea parapolymorpha DL-1]KAG7865054.1 hypothetical protein KL918_004930 [Ogataea parapolymorpha]KAG7872261.1 hypothetical protein KL916_003284 [Ogataea parapolymorpha]